MQDIPHGPEPEVSFFESGMPELAVLQHATDWHDLRILVEDFHLEFTVALVGDLVHLHSLDAMPKGDHDGSRMEAAIVLSWGTFLSWSLDFRSRRTLELTLVFYKGTSFLFRKPRIVERPAMGT